MTTREEFKRRPVPSTWVVNKELEDQDRGVEKETHSSAIVWSKSDGDCIVNNNNNNNEYDQSNVVAANLKCCGSNGSKPPTGRIRKGLNGELGFKSFGDGKAIVVDDEMDYSEQVCSIKNLDNGEEFVVNEIREDGMWNKLKEVGTWRQMKIEEFEICARHSLILQELMRTQNVEEGNKDNVNLIVNGGVSMFQS
ncbi:hypothetical protein V6N12_062636 [Hibiscus sabdariffa]|uniref:Uncharacterized protein n=1 Tax=Hibiscus sabdariffa TaxID=183260 RepID=A0ABR2F9L1_9ROSI